MFERVTVTQLNDHIWLLDDKQEATGYLVAGRDRALVIDTMNGYEDVRSIAGTLTDKPVLAINTHGHPDHIFGNVWFDSAMIDERDLLLAEQCCAIPEFARCCGEHGLSMPPFVTVKEGDVIDLGGVTAEIVSLPGHTPGSICILLREDRILFTGDSINRHLWMQLEESLPLCTFMGNLDRIASLKGRADRILHGHARGFEDISLFDKMREGIRQLCEQQGTEITDKDPVYNWFGGTALQHEFDKDSVIVYTRAKLVQAHMESGTIDSRCGIDCLSCGFGNNGSCESETNGCSCATALPGSVCPNLTCAREKRLEGCWMCPEMPICHKGFYGIQDVPAVQLAKAGAMFIRKYGKSSFAGLLYRIRTDYKERFNDFFKFNEKSSAQELLEVMEAFFAKVEEERG